MAAIFLCVEILHINLYIYKAPFCQSVTFPQFLNYDVTMTSSSSVVSNVFVYSAVLYSDDTLSNGMGGWWLIVSHIPMCNAAESTSWCPPRVGDRMFLLAKDITFWNFLLKNLIVSGYAEDVMFAYVEQRHFSI